MQNTYKKFKIERLDKISPSFCAAKWLQIDLYLHTGVTSSCNFPQPTPIDLDSIEANPLLIHNTKEKIQQRKEMLAGIQPHLCSNCWNVENSDSEAISHRIQYSYRHKDTDFLTLDLSDTIIPKHITIAFDSLCNFTCSYCDASQSSSWATDLKMNGSYIGIKSDNKKTYQRLGSKDLLDKDQYELLYSQTLVMIEQNLAEIKSINLLGGEPTMSPVFWNFMEWLSLKDTKHINLRITTNLSHPRLINDILDYQKKFKQIKLAVSIDGYRKTAEFIRYGLRWSEFERNVQKLLTQDPNFTIDFLGTVNILSLDSLLEHLDWYHELYKKFPGQTSIMLNPIRWPIFQTIMILPDYLKTHYLTTLKDWINFRGSDFENAPHLLENLNSICILLKIEKEKNSNVELQNDFKKFITEFARRKKIDIKQTFSKILTDWIEDNYAKTF